LADREQDVQAAEEPEDGLMRRCVKGDKEAFGVIVKRYAGRATGAAYLLLGSYDDAQDASQEAFVRAWRHIKRFDAALPFYPWYSTILRNVCVSRLRHRSRRPTVELEEGRARTGPEDSPVLLAERSERRDRIWQAILTLSPTQREVIVMNHFQGMSYKEMAAALEIPIGTVMSRLHNARQALRRKLTEEET
jgi:RNA polymerase sigma-70 factor (ECF subfamily)